MRRHNEIHRPTLDWTLKLCSSVADCVSESYDVHLTDFRLFMSTSDMYMVIYTFVGRKLHIFST